jgi:hypothetical protein
MVAKTRNVPYTLLLTIANTFRNQRRVFFVEVALIVSGTIFMMVIGVNDATKYTFGDKLTAIHTYDINLQFEGFERSQRLEKLALKNPNVTEAEAWLVTSGKRAQSPRKTAK